MKAKTTDAQVGMATQIINRAIIEARREGYEMALAHAERALHEGEEALFQLLRRRKEG